MMRDEEARRKQVGVRATKTLWRRGRVGAWSGARRNRELTQMNANDRVGRVPPKNSTGNENDGFEAESDRETAE